MERVGLVGPHAGARTRTAAPTQPFAGRGDEVRDRAPLAPPAPDETLDLSVVVVFYNMRREAARTLHSLSRAYQRGIDDLDYEVIVVENGSDEDQRLGEEFVRSFGPEFRYLDLGEDATPSPTDALNRAIKIARGTRVRAHDRRCTRRHPGRPAVRHGRACAPTSPRSSRPNSGTSGPGSSRSSSTRATTRRRGRAVRRRSTGRPTGTGSSRSATSSATATGSTACSRATACSCRARSLEQVGGFDDSFSMPGGGYANLDLWERLASSPDVTMVSILGEGSFHQVHGGTTTNDSAHDDRRSKIFGYGEHYEELRGRLLRGPAKPMHYVGTLGGRRRAPHAVAPHDRVRLQTPPHDRMDPTGSRDVRSRSPTSSRPP